MKIGFFGDSFCNHESTAHSDKNGYETYIRQVKNHYNADIINTGHGGSSIWDLYLLQLKPLIDKNEIPDVTVCVWTSYGRLFHRVTRGIHYSAGLEGYNHKKAEHFKKLLPELATNFFKKEVWDAAQAFYLNLYDTEKEELEHVSFIQYLDNNVFSNWPTNKKLIHLWSFGKYNEDTSVPAEYPHTFKNGVELRPPLFYISAKEGWKNYPIIDDRANHLGTQESNNIVANAIIKAIDNYEPHNLLFTIG